jgi:ferric-dicitrate binding protein FerR (iron transport regulator)
MMEKTDFEMLCQSVLEGNCTEEDFQKLEEELNSSPLYRSLFRETFVMHEMLSGESNLFATEESRLQVLQIETALCSKRRRTVVRTILAAAAVAILALVLKTTATREGTPTLRITAGPNSKYSVSKDGRSSAVRDELEPGASVTLSEGTLELQFSSGVQSIVQAPANFTLQSAQQLNMEIGVARFEVPENARGFTVVTPRLEVIDLGTTFGVVEQPDEPAQTHVFKGEVKARPRTAENTTLLKAGAAVEESGRGQFVDVPLDDSLFFKELPWDLPFVHLSFEPDEAGSISLEGCHPSLQSSTVTLHPDGRGLTDGILGKAAFFEGEPTPVTSNWKGVGGTVPRTICAWIRQEPGLSARRYQTIVSWGDPTIGLAAKCEMLLYQSEPGDSTVLRLSFDQYLYTGSTELADGRWHHLAAVCRTDPMGKKSPVVELYVDGKREPIDPKKSITDPKIKQRPDTRIGRKGSMPLVVGYTDRPDSGRGFRGAIDEVYVFEATLPEERILKLMKPGEGKR